MPITAKGVLIDTKTPIEGGIGIHSAGTTIDVVVNNTTLGVVQPTNPYALLDGTEANHANYKPIKIPRAYTHAEIFHVFRGAIQTAPVVNVFGRLPDPPMQSSSLKQWDWPQDVDPGGGWFNLYAPESPGNTTSIKGVWIPLPDAAGVQGIITGTTVAMVSGTSAFSLTQGVRVPLRGCTRLLCLLATNGAYTTGAGMICVRFSS